MQGRTAISGQIDRVVPDATDRRIRAFRLDVFRNGFEKPEAVGVRTSAPAGMLYIIIYKNEGKTADGDRTGNRRLLMTLTVESREAG